MSKILRLLRNEPVTRIDISDFRVREELLDRRDHCIGDITALGTAYKQGRSVVLYLAGLVPGEIGHFVQRLGEDVERDTELQMAVVGADEIREEKLADGERLFPLYKMDRTSMRNL